MSKLLGFFFLVSGMLMLAGCGRSTGNDALDFEEIWGKPESALPILDLDQVESGQNPFVFTSSTGEQVRYQLHIPGEFDREESYPLLVFLHGSNGVGENIAQIADITPPAVWRPDWDFPLIVVSPQNPAGIWTEYIEAVDELVGHLAEVLQIDKEGMILTGLSDGGYGTWFYALRYPERFDAIVPISYGPVLRPDDPMPDLCALSGVEVWIFHAQNDDVIPIEPNFAAVEALEKCGNGDVQFTVYRGAGHTGAWLKAYQSAALYQWMLRVGD